MIRLLKQEVIPALGCTEPICAAFAAADAAKAAGGTVKSIYAEMNPNLYKNGMSVSIPNSPRMGMDVAVALGATLKNPQKKLEVLEDITPQTLEDAYKLLDNNVVNVRINDSEKELYVKVMVTTSNGVGTSIIRSAHTNIILTTVDGKVIFEKATEDQASGNDVIERLKQMKVAEIRQLVDTADSSELQFMMDGVVMNEALAQYDIQHIGGVGIAATIQQQIKAGILSDSLQSRVMLKAAAAAEGRLGGCPLPTMSSSGSGTKGVVVILPIYEVAKEVKASELATLKALAFGHLMNRYINAFIGKLGAVCSCSMASATATCAAMTWLYGGTDEQIGFAIRNMTAAVSGMICDGGKVGCALKAVMTTTSALTNALLASHNIALHVSDGICAETPEQCILNMARIANPGMVHTDKEILNIMLEKSGKK